MSTMVHLDYPRSENFLQWDELECLSRALGFPSDYLLREIPKEYTEKSGITIENFYYLINKHHCFDRAVDHTFNIHSPQWNLKVIKKSVYLLSHRAISFKQLFDIRIAYGVYETLDTRGLLTEEERLRRALKMCNFQISPMKKRHRLKHMQQAFTESNRMQLDEFMQLILWCKKYQEWENKGSNLNLTKDFSTGLYELEDFNELLHHHDEKMGWKLDEEYLQEERAFSKERHGSKRLPKESTIDPEVRRRMVYEHMRKYMPLKEEMNKSEGRVQSAQAGYIRDRPITTPRVINDFQSNNNSQSQSTDNHPNSLQDRMKVFYKRPKTSHAKNTKSSKSQSNYPARPYSTPPVIRQEDVEELERNVSNLKFSDVTLVDKYKKRFVGDMEYLYPGFSQRSIGKDIRNARRPKTAPVGQRVGTVKRRILMKQQSTQSQLNEEQRQQEVKNDILKGTEAVVGTKNWKLVLDHMENVPIIEPKSKDVKFKMRKSKRTEKAKLSRLVNLVEKDSPYMARKLAFAAVKQRP
ncbi:DgyrCDS14348 [Dimorphilus gyrociliatus]|uniref:DgyrCDS14348 n=1 Tax=Dimorphilus gyrociliatus TaxID=2664684 RepID=A0A7I8WDI0_9ANNE|nr:DgyrCDS14348 [Dimorphilus gyrociliatus]